MATITIVGWKLGFRKISHTKLIQNSAALSLAQAKGVTDQILAGETVELEIDDGKAESFRQQLQELGAITD